MGARTRIYLGTKPETLSTATHDAINYDPEAFQARIKATAYALDMHGTLDE